MEHYIENTIQLDEDIIISPKLHWAVYMDTYIQLSLLYLIFCNVMDSYMAGNLPFRHLFEQSQTIIGVAILLRIIYRFVCNYSIEMAVTNYRVVYKIGIFNVRTQELANEKTESVSVHQSLLGRILNYGDIYFSGTGTSKLVFAKVYAPWWIKSKVEDIIRQSYMKMHSPTYRSRYDDRR